MLILFSGIFRNARSKAGIAALKGLHGRRGLGSGNFPEACGVEGNEACYNELEASPVADSLLFEINQESGSDARLASALREGSQEAYELLVARFQQPVYNLVYRLMADPGDSYDVVQEVFLKVFRNIGTFRNQSSLKTWIYRIAVNEVHNYRRWLFRHRRQEVVLDDDSEGGKNFGDAVADRGRSPYDYALNGEKRVMIEDALARINPIFRAAVVLRDVEDLSYEEIADVLDISLGTVKSRITRGREAMRRQLEGQLEPQPTFQWDTAAG
jgi:RNA polymerase sigma-70 factor, ECF subfamily